jgi:hypothetical protein
MSHAHATSRRSLPLLAVLAALALALVAAAPAGASISPLLASFSTTSFSDFNDGANTTNATLSVVADRAYDSSYSAYANYPGGGVNAYARVIQDVAWGAGDDVWYGAAYYLPVGFKAAMQQEVSLQRWDNYSTYGSNGDLGGIAIWNSDKLARLKLGRYDASTETLLTNGFSLPEGRWFWLEVHQRFSATSGSALNEVYLDGTLVGHSTTANYDRPIQKLRTGLVAQGGIAQTNSLSLWFDRVSINGSAVGPAGGTSTGPAPTPTPTPVAPAVTITSPADGTSFGDSLGMNASVTDDTGVAKVDFLIDGQLVATRTSAPWSYTYDSRSLSSGWHTVTIRATDLDGLTGQASVRVNHRVKQHGSARAAAATTDTRIRMRVHVHRRAHHARAHHRHHRKHRHRHAHRHHRHHRRHRAA